jgi:hypothetical protein
MLARGDDLGDLIRQWFLANGGWNAAMGEKEAISRNRAADDCIQFSAGVFPVAVRHLAAFAHAVNGFYGPEQARQSAEDWLEELELTEWPEGETAPDWRQITIAAAARLADRIDLRSQTCPVVGSDERLGN